MPDVVTLALYAVLVVLWGTLLVVFLRRIPGARREDPLIAILLSVLALDAFATLFESAYLGTYFSAVFGYLPEPVAATLSSPLPLALPKLVTIAAGVTMLLVVVQRWLPAEMRQQELWRELLRDEEQRLRDFAEAASDWFWELDQNLCYSWISEAFERASGIPPSRVLGRPWAEVARADLEPLAWRRHLERLAERRPFSDFEFALDGPSGRQWLRASGVPIVDGEGRFLGYRGTARDITLAKARERELVDARNEAEAALHAKSEFLANMSHELRTPLNAILGFSEVLEREHFGPVNQKQREYLRDIHAAGSHLLSLIDDILNYTKLETGRTELHVQSIDVAEAVAEATSLERVAVRNAKLQLHTALAPDLPRLLADRRAVRQMLLNLLSNAIKFTPPGGEIEVAAEVEGDHLVLAVSDTGCGIPENEIETVLQPFRQASQAMTKAHEGTGLGLSIVRMLVEAHGGRIELTSAVDVGTTVRLYFPLQSTASGASAAAVTEPS